MNKIAAVGVVLILLLLTLALFLSTGVVVFAEGGSDTLVPSGSQSIDVTAKQTTDSLASSPVYSVDITWDDMTFTYHAGQTVWDPTTHTYIQKTAAGWDKTTANITVTNHSNAEVGVDLAYVKVVGSGVNGSLSVVDGLLNAGEEDAYDGADMLTSTLTVSGTPSDAVSAEGTKVGAITITVSAVE